jgi:LPXTG-motif cell wall-anchored protein
VTDETCVLNDGSAEAEITVTARDIDNNAVSGVTVYLYQDGNADMSPSSRTTDSSGRARFTVSNETDESVTFTASASGYTIDRDVNVRFSPTCNNANVASTISSVFSAAVGDPCYNVNQGGVVAFTLRDANSNVLPNVSMRVSPSISTGVTVTPQTTTTDANGQVFITIDSDREQTVAFSFIANDATFGSMTAYTFTGVFKTSCLATLPKTGSLDTLVLVAMGGLAALPPGLAVWRRRRRASR